MPRRRNEYSHLVPSLLSDATQDGFDRAIHRALSGVKGSAAPLRRLIVIAMRELDARSMDSTAALAHLNSIVENAGRGGAGDRMSLMSGQPRWMAIRDQVLADARATLRPGPVAWTGPASASDVSSGSHQLTAVSGHARRPARQP